MKPGLYPSAAGGPAEPALVIDRKRPWRLLIVPALFDEANRMRRLTVEVMRRLDAAGIDTLLPDYPGCNESTADFTAQTPAGWTAAMLEAKRHFEASHVLGIRGGCLFAPEALHTWHYAPASGESQLRQMLRARVVASREAGREESRETLLETGRTQGIELAGYRFGAQFLREFESLVPAVSPHHSEIPQAMLGGSPLWLRAEPDENPEQADALAAIIAIGITQ